MPSSAGMNLVSESRRPCVDAMDCGVTRPAMACPAAASRSMTRGMMASAVSNHSRMRSRPSSLFAHSPNRRPTSAIASANRCAVGSAATMTPPSPEPNPMAASVSDEKIGLKPSRRALNVSNAWGEASASKILEMF